MTGDLQAHVRRSCLGSALLDDPRSDQPDAFGKAGAVGERLIRANCRLHAEGVDQRVSGRRLYHDEAEDPLEIPVFVKAFIPLIPRPMACTWRPETQTSSHGSWQDPIRAPSCQQSRYGPKYVKLPIRYREEPIIIMITAFGKPRHKYLLIFIFAFKA